MAEIPYIPSPVVEAIDAKAAADYVVRDSVGIGFSYLGEECERRLWYVYRWTTDPDRPEGQRARLFQTGNLEEARLLDLLRGIGVEVVDRDEKGRQFWVSILGGRSGGYLDAEALGIPGAEKTWHVVECKTANNKTFNAIKKHGVEQAKPEHFVQMQMYMHVKGRTRALYLVKNKDTDELYAERIEYNATFCLSLEAKAERIVSADRPPMPLYEDPDAKAAWKCKGSCPALRLCHPGKTITVDKEKVEIEPDWARRNCRTCLHSTSGETGRWSCDRHQRALSREELAAGCAQHLYIPDLVAGEQIDADEEGETVTYRLIDGQVWVDGNDLGEGE